MENPNLNAPALFILATRAKFLFPSAKGDLTTEQVWDLPLIGRTGADLDSVARAVNKQIKEIDDESFVEVNPDPRLPELKAKLEIVKFMIATKQDEEAAAKTRSETRARRQKLLAAIEAQENQVLSTTSLDDLKKQLAELDA